jgi:hypothetical protein
MKSFVLSALVLFSASASSAALPGALVWLPPADFSRWSEVDALLRARDLKLTVGLTPEMATPLVRAALAPWAAKGRVEIAARISGDPILTLVDSHPAAPRPQDALERAVEARETLSKNLEMPVSGLITGAGALDGSLASALGASGATWILTGPYASDDKPWVTAGKSLFIPARPLSSTADAAWTAPGAQVYDESMSASSFFLTVAAGLPESSRPDAGWATVGELPAAQTDARFEAATVGAWPAWNAAAALVPPVDPTVKAAWSAYGAAAEAVDRYQNSGAADLRTLDAAVELLRRAQASRHYRAGPEAPPTLRVQLQAVYKRLKLAAPESLYETASSSTSTTSNGEGPTGVKASSGPSWLEFRAPAGMMALAPVVTSGAAVSDGKAAADAWRIQSLRAQWDDASVRLILRMAGVAAPAPRPVYEIYIDFNHVLGAGRMALLEGRGAIVPARDAWEMAMSINDGEARLYRARGAGEPEEIGTFKAAWDAGKVEVAVDVPRSVLRGNPARWGWAVVALAEDPAKSGRHPAASLVGADGTILLGVLAPKDVAKAVLTRANSRVPAARLEP